MMEDPLELFLSKHPDVQEPAQASHLPTMPVASPAGDPAAPDDELERFLAGGEDVNRLKLSMQESAKVAPDVAQRILRLQTQTGLPKEYLERNLDAVERETAAQAFDAETFKRTSPSLSAWLAEHPNHPAAARQDLTKLNYLERQLRYIGANKEIGELQDELIGIGERSMNEAAGPAERARQAAIEARLKELEALNAGTDITGFLEQIPGVAVQQWPVNKRVIGGMAEGATKGLVIGAAGGGAMGGVPGAVAGGLTMLAPAALVGGGLEAGKAEMHSALLEYEKLKDENGLPLARTTIKGLALMAGVANGTLEMAVGLEPLMLKVPGIRSLTREGLTELLKTPTSREAVVRFARTIGLTMAEEGITEAMQMYVTKLGGAIGQTMQDGGSILDRVFTSDTAAQAVQEARAGAQGGGGMAMPMASVTAAVDLKRAKEAKRMQQAFENIGAVAAETKLRESLPGTLRQIIESATKDGPVETLYLPVDTFSTYFQSKGADPRAVAAALTGSPEEYDQAVASGSDLAVKTADYAEIIAGTEHNAFFAQEVRPSMAAMNAREADAWMAEQVNPDVLPGVQTAAADDPVARVRQEIAGQLEALGFDPSVVDQYAQLYQSRYQARAERRGLGENAFDLFRKAGLTIQRVLPEILQKVGGNTTELDALLDRLRSGDVPKPGDIYGRSLLEALREIGLKDDGGEVSAIDPDQARRPFEKKLIQEQGLSLDQAAERMHEAGYLQERSIEQLLEAMRQEAAGNPIYVPGAENALLLDVSQKLEDLRHYLTEQGVDLTATPNEQIKAMFDRLLSTEEAPAVGQDQASAEGTTFEQGRSLKAEADRVIALYGEDESISVETANRLAREGNPDAGMAALVAYVSDDFAAITSAPESPAAQALMKLVQRLPKDKTGTLYRVLAFPTKKARQAFVDKFTGADTVKTDRPVMSFTIDDPEGGHPMTHIGLDVASQFGKFNVELHLEAGRSGQSAGVDISSLYGEGETDPGLDVLVPGETPLRVLEVTKRDGTIVIRAKLGSSAAKATFFQSAPDVPPFYSKVEQVIAEKMGGKAKVGELLKMLAANTVKEEELKWSGLDEFLKGKETVTKAEVQQFLENNRVEIKDVVLGGAPGITEAQFWETNKERVKALRELGWETSVEPPETDAPDPIVGMVAFYQPDGDGMMGDLLTWDELPDGGRGRNPSAKFLARQIVDSLKGNASQPKFAQWKEPGGENYREILLTLPAKTKMIQPSEVTVFKRDGAWMVQSPDGRQSTRIPGVIGGSTIDEAEARGYAAQIFNRVFDESNDQFVDGHYDVPNVLAHVRVVDRVDQQGRRVLFVEEIQSDWHQKGRKQGYRKKWAQEEVDQFQVIDRGGNAWLVIDGAGNVLAAPPKHLNHSAEDALATARKMALKGTLDGIGKVPDAPFKKTWHELAIKYLLRHAAENGYDVMAWATGEMNANRYDLRKQVSAVAYEKNDDGTYHLWVTPIGAQATDRIRETDLSAIPEQGLSEIVGKDLAQKIVAGEGERPLDEARDYDIEQVTGATRTGDGSVIRWRDGSESIFDSPVEAKRALLDEYARQLGIFDRGEGGRRRFTGVDLKVGGSGMKGFYDKIVPTFLNKYGKKWGAKVEEVKIGDVPVVEYVIEDGSDDGHTFIMVFEKGATEDAEPAGQFDSRAEAEAWVAERSPKVRPVFEPISDVQWDGLAGAESWENGDRPLYAETKVRIFGEDYPVSVVLSKEGISISGMHGDESWEYMAGREEATPEEWGSAEAAKAAVMAMWNDERSGLWESMTPIHGLDWLSSDTMDLIGPVPDKAVAMEVQGVPITEPMKVSVMKSGQPLFQAGGGKDAKGQITFGAGRIDIALLEKADLSTFIHETGHLYLNELIEDALTPGVPQQLRDDLDSILDWMGLAVRVTDGEDAIKAAIGRDQHELFARGFEAYALEGKSPSLAMREVFAKFRQWLIQVYRLITYRDSAADPGRIGATLQVNLTPEVRKVMNRMVATEEEIQAMEAEASVEPMFTDAASAGMTEAEFARYREHVTQAGLQAREALQAQVLAQLARERTAWWKEKYAEMQAQVLAEANQRPVYVALSVLQDGVMPDGAPLPDGLVAGKLSKQAVAAVFGRDFVRKLPRGTTTASGGMTPGHAAALFGYQSAEDLLTDLANARSKKELVDAEAHLRMTREYGDPLIDGTLHEKARTAVLNAEREQVIEAEMAAIDKKRREVTQGALAGLMPPPESVRKLAKAQIARQRVREISPQGHFLAAQRANKAATEALWKRDYLAAGLAKQKEFLNLALYREATAAREEVERIVQHLRELRTKPRQEKIGKAGSDYLEQINAIMERYEFSPVPHITLAKRQALREWIAEKEHEGETLGEEFVVPEEILFEARKMNYKELPFEELEGIRDTIQQIEHFARAKNRLLAEQAIMEKEEVRTLLINQLLANTPARLPQALTESSMTRGEKVSRLAERYNASLLKTEQLVEELDGGPTGPWHDYFWNPSADAQAAEADYTERITGKIAEAVVNIPASIRRRMLDLVTVPGLPRPMSRKEIIGAALNVGNRSNRTKLLKGMNWSERNLDEMLAHLTKEEWDFVQKVWDTLESMWPDIATLQKKLTGIAPEKVKIEPVQTKFGTYAGGYYPVMYAAALSAQGSLQLSSTFGKLLDDNYVKATLPSGYRKGRIEEFAAPFDLDVDRLPSHIAGVVKDLTHRAWLIDANWIVSDKRIRAALKERLGEALTLRMADWVGQVANDRAGGSSKSLAVWMQMIESFRMNTVIVAMGFKFSTLASQLAGVAPAIEVLGGKTGGGAKWFAVGVSEALRRPQSTYDFMVAKSGEMRHRITSRDRDLRDKLRALQGRKDLLAQLQEVSLMGIGYMELMISMPTWIAGYRRALAEEKTDEQAIRAGDRAVRLSQGAAGAKDLAAVAGRSDTMMRLLTMFYTPFSALYNRLRAIGHDVEGIGDLPRAAVRLWLTVTVAATLGEILAGHGPDKDEPWWRWWMRVQAIYPFLAVPLLRDAISTLSSGYGYQFSPIAQALETGTRLTRSAYKAAAGEKEWEELAAQAIKAFSYFVGLPTSQLIITGKFLQDLNNGSEHPDDLFEFTKKFLYSRPKE